MGTNIYNEKEPKNVNVKRIIAAIFGVIALVLGTVFIRKYVPGYVFYILWAADAVVTVLFVISLVKNIHGLFKITLLIAYFGFLIMGAYIGIAASGVLDKILSAQSGEELYEVLKEDYGNNLYIVLILIQFLQVTFIPIPSTIVTAAGFYLCGKNIGLTILFCCIGLWAGSLFAFFLGRMFGVKLVKWIAGEKVLIKYNNLVKGKDKVMLGYMFLFPIYPDDVLCLIAGLTTMSWREFILIQILSRPINVAATVLLLYFGTSLTTLFPFTKWYGILFWIFAVLLLVASFVLVWKFSGKLEAFMTKLISKISGRPILSDINTIYKIHNPEAVAENETPINDETKNDITTSKEIEDSIEKEEKKSKKKKAKKIKVKKDNTSSKIGVEIVKEDEVKEVIEPEIIRPQVPVEETPVAVSEDEIEQNDINKIDSIITKAYSDEDRIKY